MRGVEERGQRERCEECLEALYRLERSGACADIASLRGNPDLSPIDIAGTVLDLIDTGYLTVTSEGLSLTPSGRVLGERIYHRHELIEHLLRFIGHRKALAHAEACRLEHVTMEPDEHPGPGEAAGGGAAQDGDELAHLCGLLSHGALPLTRGRRGSCYRVALVRARPEQRRKLEEMGVGRGGAVRLCTRRRGGPVEVEVRGSNLAISRDIASRILVLPEDGSDAPAHRREGGGSTRFGLGGEIGHAHRFGRHRQ
jgi:DtxR family transcriptional regulator, Mn-dependent transcriptional regulator